MHIENSLTKVFDCSNCSSQMNESKFILHLTREPKEAKESHRLPARLPHED